MLTSWVDDLCSKYKNVVLFIDKREFVKYWSDINVFKKVFVLHSTHLKSPGDDLNRIDNSMLPVFENIDKIDYFVVLTELQKKHLSEILGQNSAKLVKISHPFQEVQSGDRQDIDFHSYTVSSIARYHPAKNLVDAIKAFKLVVNVLPDAVYNIYGYGPLEQELRNLIQELNLEKNVFLKGFTKNSSEVYQDSCLTVLTSIYEGWALVIGESLSHGVPVVSYDTNYGPAEQIESGYMVIMDSWLKNMM